MNNAQLLVYFAPDGKFLTRPQKVESYMYIVQHKSTFKTIKRVFINEELIIAQIIFTVIWSQWKRKGRGIKQNLEELN